MFESVKQPGLGKGRGRAGSREEGGIKAGKGKEAGGKMLRSYTHQLTGAEEASTMMISRLWELPSVGARTFSVMLLRLWRGRTEST